MIEENKTKSFLQVKLKKTHGKIEFKVDKDIDSLKLTWNDNHQFFIAYLFGPDKKLYGQLVTVAKEGYRTISIYEKYTSPCCKSLERVEDFIGDWTLEYVAIGENKNLIIQLNIEEYCPKEEGSLSEDNFICLTNNSHNNEDTEKSWFAGDFHTHTIYSDGKMTREENNEIAKEQGLNFFVPTDHNIYHYTWPKTKNLKVYPGTEITSSLGHINLLFCEKNPFETHSIMEIEDENTLVKIIDKALDYSLVSINHPFMPPWDFNSRNFPLDKVRIMEIINDPTYKTSKEATERALKAWNILLNEGYQVVGVGGSDSHLGLDERYENSMYPSILGDPKTFLYSKRNDFYDLRNALKSGDVIVSRKDFIDLQLNGISRHNENFTGEIELVATLKEREYREKALHFNWVLDGETLKKEEGIKSSFSIDMDSNFHWVRLDIVDEEDNLYGFTNPIYFNKYMENPSIKTWGQLMEKLGNED
ncbi:CehA/McbA family metallohydrolase [Lagierella sp.]|uniref:CehA/McbA family metallohydrolase n=1 Tax=Lagierella sp. TaxID=2849657 RepID=UPI002634B088|nr:CehA/McbA family metallohydrolase [Lagierella sp.]